MIAGFRRIAKAFIEGGEPQQKFYEMAYAVNKFIEKAGPILEEVEIRLRQLEREPFGKITRKELSEEISRDLESAQGALGLYENTFHAVNERLMLMAGHYGLNDFLREEIKSSRTSLNVQELRRVVESELQKYWEDTYGGLALHFGKIHAHLDRMRNLLEQQVHLLRTVPNSGYLEGFEENRRLRKLFRMERNVFWDGLVKDAKFSAKKMNSIKKSYLLQRQKLLTQLSEFIKIRSQQITKEYEGQERKLEKGLLVFSYLLGAVETAFTIQGTVGMEGLVKFAKKGIVALLGKDRKLKSVERRIEKAILEVGSTIEKGGVLSEAQLGQVRVAIAGAKV